MKDSARILSRAFRAAGVATLFAAAACGRSNKAADVAQDSILVKDADVAGSKTDTAGAATAALVRERGSTAELPALTNGAPVTRPAGVTPDARTSTATSRTAVSQPRMQPPKTVNPMPVLPGRESTSKPIRDSIATASPVPPKITPPTPVSQPTPVVQPVSPQPKPVGQPLPPPPKKDTSTDSLRVSRRTV